MKKTVHPAIAILAAAGLGTAAAPAIATEGAPEHRADLAVGFTTRAPASPTGLDFDVIYRSPHDPDAKPPAISGVRIALPDGTRIDGTAIPRCTASDAQLRLLGRAACPPGSELGRGELEAMTGFGPPVDPLRGDLTLFNGGDQIIELVTFPGTNLTAAIDRLRIDGSTLTGDPPSVPGGPPDGRTAVRRIRFTLPARTSPAGTYLTTPPACPPTGNWTTRGDFSFADGGAGSATSTTPCQRPTAALVTQPRFPAAGRRTTFRVDVHSPDHSADATRRSPSADGAPTRTPQSAPRYAPR